MSEHIGLHLAQLGIPSDVDYVYAGEYEPDPWRPPPGAALVQISITMKDAERLDAILQRAFDKDPT